MKKNYSKPSILLKITIVVIGLLFFDFSFAQNITSTEDGNWHQIVWSPSQLPQPANDVTISNSIIIEQDKVVEINNLDIGKTGSLTVNGTLIINGSIDMDNNGSYFEMGASSRVIIFGDFSASNKVNVSISSYLIIHGNFTKKGNEGKGNFNVENGNIYIYGDVDGWPNFGSCDTGEDYTGTPQESGSCDYGNEDDFANNPDIPDDIIELSNCYDLKVNDQFISIGENAVFTASDKELQDVASYQWQTKNRDGKWIDLAGENQFQLEIPNVQLEDTNAIYRVIVRGNSNKCRISISNAALIKIKNPIIINSQPKSNTTCQGTAVNFYVDASGQNLSYQWERNDGGDSENYFAIKDNTYFQNSQTSNLTVNAQGTWLNNIRFRVVIKDEYGNEITSDFATLKVDESPGGVYTQPKNQVVCEGHNISFQTYTSNDLRQWQVSEDDGNSWSNLTNNDFYKNVNSERLDITNAPASFNDNLYRVEVSNENCRVYSIPATLKVDPDPITKQPQDVTAEFGSNALIEAGVTGNNLTFQWQTFSSNWYDIEDGSHYAGTKTKLLELITVGYWPEDGSRYRLLVTNENGCISISDTAVLNIREDLCKTKNTWTGTENSNWNNTNNWSCNSLPTLETDVLIPENITSGNYPEITAGANALARNLNIENNASVMVTDNWLRIAGDLTNKGILATESGSISFEGTSTQIIPVNAFENNRIQNLQINNTSRVTSEAIIEVTGTLKVENGYFYTGNQLTLISNEIKTALIDGSGNGEVIGQVSMQRYLDKAFGYKYFSTPFKNTVVGDFGSFMNFTDPVTGFPNFYRYNENRRVENLNLDASGWEAYANTTNTLNTAEGYALNLGKNTASQTIELTGEVNNGSVSVRQLENNHRKYTRGFHLVGNPYPSPIDWDAPQGWIRNNIDNGIYFFTASNTNQYTGTYTAYVNDISTGNINTPNIIPSMQGFFIKVSDSDTQEKVIGSFGMDNRVRTNNFGQQFYRSQINSQKSLIRLEAGFKGAKDRDAMIVYFSPYATSNFEKEMDAHKLMNTDPRVPSLYNISQDRKELAINAISYPETKSYKKIPLGIKADENGEMTIGLARIEGLNLNLNIYLIDHLKGIGQNLSKKPVYNFNIKKGTHNSRFELMFSEEEVTSPAIAFNEPFDIKVQNGTVLVHLNLDENQKGILKATTITGQILQIKEASGTNEVIFEGITSNGVYIINLQVGKALYAKKIVIKK
ncbi:T9SS type A sorting domain-containing protein [uncultured Salegentibacter sp.]|uniref:T9SS type A sorting domain-containing protein n=1 Tax=uncultured Salegentibacter sp. TaxID=259320 RepID=UPI002595C3F5|nr:T9SS type A sorting domain-containing protein [uncultured Salegentibacter sp.]